MQNTTDWIALIVSLLGILISSVIALMVYLNSRQSQQAEIHREIEHTYDKLMEFRANHPEVMALSREWSGDCFKSLYAQPGKETKLWVIYYTYVELCIGFINAVLYGKDVKLLGERAYQYHLKPLIKLLLSEHYPYIKSILQGKYLSDYIKGFIIAEQKSDWNWQESHNALADK